MSFADWYLALFSAGAGIGIVGFWVAVLARGRLAEVAGGREDIRFHVAAELATGAVLVAGAATILVEPDGRAAGIVAALGLGMLAYSLVQSPGHYFARRDRKMLAMFAGTWLFAVPAVILRFVA